MNRMYDFPKANSCHTLGVSLPRSVKAMVSLPSGLADAGTTVAGTAVAAGTLVSDEPSLGAWVASEEDPQATATTNIIDVSAAMRNGI
tara:strand:- start:2446 stop:2709 length:264 start_codon:yes stop_codon:yes gene_type:complete